MSQLSRYVAFRNSSVVAKLLEPKRKRISAGTSYPGSGMCRDAMVAERFHELLKEKEMLKLSLLSLTTYKISPQTDRGSPLDKKEEFIKSFKSIFFGGIPELTSKATKDVVRT